ncbi:tRNA-dihydrouridine(16/17) synthase [NAD(P)(+)]-like [Thrips palmi]|uniref:tRNA-dihydrouridine(16/17) synthase [NAD(P)(+)]-like n=1 Tax=Thrips palmi TaxID=161013 RepID=A0A6P9A424_THRPL|nr:tRNA-dihydrouridine(16/17) synthase [NAD(P)(+)]-like [Thrips palmi]XP_034251975.1 tRNA-dihydrouridine(16/17) synthase [NAD(P)(+)]-like [Thrips palmi]XP_034251976.1 tRNA-dihydrouridine(16/17) synthase [NAD(P)(+)]-like [Thrips palmi]
MLPDAEPETAAEAGADVKRPKLCGEAFWRSLGSPRLVVAPMVDASELAWRLLSRRHAADLCYTPMLHSSVFTRDARYRAEALASTPEDRPLIVQFCANNTAVLLEAALLAEPFCDAVDINLGCPQAIARRGHYGSFLQDDWDLLKDMVSTLNERLSVPVTCKIRVFPDVARTVEYARMLEAAGCQMLTVHGRTRDQKGPLTGLASWPHIRAVVESVNIPVFANGNIQFIQDVDRCIAETGVKGVMSAEGNLYNPALFEGTSPPCWELCLEYLDLAEKYPCPTSFVRTHLFKMMHHLLSLPENAAERQGIAKGQSLADFRQTVLTLRDRFLPYHDGIQVFVDNVDDTCNLRLPPWLCQPYVRIPPEEHLRKLADRQNKNDEPSVGEKRCLEETEEDPSTPQLSKKKLKKLQHSQKVKANPHIRKCQEKCSECANPLGQKCGFKLCRACCRKACFSEKRDCTGHRILTKTRYEKLLQYQAQEAAAGEEQAKSDFSEKNNNASSESGDACNLSNNGQPGAVSDNVSVLQSCRENKQSVSVNSSNDSNGV